jgi:hypothetical protein
MMKNDLKRPLEEKSDTTDQVNSLFSLLKRSAIKDNHAFLIAQKNLGEKKYRMRVK